MENNENTCTSPCCCDCQSPCGGHVYNSLPVGTWPPHCCNGCGIQVGTTNVYDSNQQKWQDEINQEINNKLGNILSIEFDAENNKIIINGIAYILTPAN